MKMQFRPISFSLEGAKRNFDDRVIFRSRKMSIDTTLDEMQRLVLKKLKV